MKRSLSRIALAGALVVGLLGGCAVYAPPADEGYAYSYYEEPGPVYVAPAPRVYVAPPPLYFNFGYHGSWGGHGRGRGWHGRGWRH